MTEEQDKLQILKLSTDGKQNQFSPFFVTELTFARKSVFNIPHTFFLISLKDRRKNGNSLSERPGDQRT